MGSIKSLRRLERYDGFCTGMLRKNTMVWVPNTFCTTEFYVLCCLRELVPIAIVITWEWRRECILAFAIASRNRFQREEGEIAGNTLNWVLEVVLKIQGDALTGRSCSEALAAMLRTSEDQNEGKIPFCIWFLRRDWLLRGGWWCCCLNHPNRDGLYLFFMWIPDWMNEIEDPTTLWYCECVQIARAYSESVAESNEEACVLVGGHFWFARVLQFFERCRSNSRRRTQSNPRLSRR